jgi:hypothetical protein
LIPPGTPKSKVDEILVVSAKFGQPYMNSPGNYTYTKHTYANLGGSVLNIIFNEDNKTSSLFLGANKLY